MAVPSAGGEMDIHIAGTVRVGAAGAAGAPDVDGRKLAVFIHLIIRRR